MPDSPWVKVCGVTRPEDGALAATLGAGFVGINFWPRSPRHLADLERARAVAEAARLADPAVRVVGVFVDQPPAWIEEVAGEVGLDLIQLHGDEPQSVSARFGERTVRALSVTSGGASAPTTATARSSQERSNSAFVSRQKAFVFAFLFESPTAGARRGGTGQAWDWTGARSLVKTASPVPVFVAGGVRPDNAATALRGSGARGIDVASGVESAPGIKDGELLRRLFAALQEEVER